jgi:hypothetical protein
MTFQAEWMAPEVLRNEPSDEKYANISKICFNVYELFIKCLY